MEIQLQELIDQVKRDGVEAAETEAASILAAARAQAEKIIAEAEFQAEQILANAEIENARVVKSGEDAIRQAGRNMLISFRESVARELRSVLNENVAAVYSSAEMARLIMDVIVCWSDKPDTESVAVLLNSADLKSLEEALRAGVKERLLKGVTLKANDNFTGGFRISVNNGNAYYDYSAEAVAEILSNYLSPKVIALLKEAE